MPEVEPGTAYVAGTIYALLHSVGYDVTPTEDAAGVRIVVAIMGGSVYEIRVGPSLGPPTSG